MRIDLEHLPRRFVVLSRILSIFVHM